ncbi:MAG: acetoacetate decarboxylase family protein [Candidatus Jordarchaeaceae archaeon]
MSLVRTTEDMLRLLEGLQGGVKFYNAEMLITIFLTTPEFIKKILPPPLQPPEIPLGLVYVANFPKTTLKQSYHEAAIFLDTLFEGKPGNYCLTMPVDNDMAMVQGRELVGFPKKMAEISLEKKGERILGKVTRRGVEILKIQASLTGQKLKPEQVYQLFAADKDERGMPIHTYLIRGLVSLKPESKYKPQLICYETRLLPKKVEMLKNIELIFGKSELDPLQDIEVVEVEGGIYGTFENTMVEGKIVGEFEDITSLLPYLLYRYDL